MASISATTKHKVAVPVSSTIKSNSTAKGPKNPTIGVGRGVGKKPVAKKTGAPGARRGAVAPPLRPSALSSSEAIAKLKALDANGRKEKVEELCREALGVQSLVDKSKPHAATTTRSRSSAAADVAVAARELGIPFVMKQCHLMDEMQRMLFPGGIQALFKESTESNGGVSKGLKPSASAVSLTSLDETTVASVNSMGTDSKRGKTTPPDAREGSLLLIRGFCETLGKAIEPYVVGAFLAACLDECGSSSSAVREAAEDAASALVKLANPWAFPCLISPLLLQSLESNEWRVKFNALERLGECARTAPEQVCRLLPTLIPAITSQVFDTKAQVTKAAASTLLAICQTNTNPDIEPAIPAVVAAICKPAETNKAVEELMGTTFVTPVEAPSLSILCPVLSRALKEKLAIHKRAACIVISNMSRLVSSPEDVSPFGHLLVPELQKVATNVQFEEIRDEALKALANLTKALGDAADEIEKAKRLAEESARVEAERKRIQDERDAEAKREEELRRKEEAERKRFKEAMDAQRELAKVEEERAKQERLEEQKKREQEKRSTKGAQGKCQGCGLKKCKKSCLFFSGK